jgi:hypothetical protein
MGQPEFRDGLNSLVLVVEPYNQTFQLGRAYKPHPRVQRMFKKLLMLRQQREKEQLANSKNEK